MSLQAKTFLNLIAGGVAGVLAWLLTDATGWYASHLGNQSQLSAMDSSLLFYGALFGLLLGLLLGVVDAISLDSQRQMMLTLVSGAVIGFIGGGIGMSMGQTAFGWLGGGAGPQSPGHFFLDLIARAIGWGIIGAVVGAASGVARRSPTIIKQGLFGGLCGGLLGGAAFQIVADVFMYVPHIDVLSRLLALVATGALAGFFVGLVQNLFKQAWIKVMVGRNEGKEYLISKPVTAIGRSELSDIGLYGDPTIAPTHAVIESLPAQNRHRVRHVAGGQGANAYPPTMVNGRPVTAEQWLTDGDTIQIGSRTLLFAEKATRGRPRVTAEQPGVAQAAPASPMPAPDSQPGQRPPLAAPADIIAQMGTAPEANTNNTTVLSQFAASVTEKDDTTVRMDVGSLATPGPGSRLTVVRGPYAGQSFPLSHLPTTIGRSQDRSIPLPADTSVSRTHARIAYENGQHQIADDGSSNGTYVNHVRLSGPRPLRPGDTIELGDTEMRYE